MSPDFQLLHELIKVDALALPSVSTYGKKSIFLKESGNRNMPEYTLEITNVPDEIIAIKADIFHPLDNIFNCSNGECKRADFVIIANNIKSKWIIYIEMKSGRGGARKEIVQQLKGAHCFVTYCRAIGQSFWQNSQFLENKNYQHRFVSVKNIGMRKKPTRILPTGVLHDNPENMLKISAPGWNTLQFKSLVSS